MNNQFNNKKFNIGDLVVYNSGRIKRSGEIDEVTLNERGEVIYLIHLDDTELVWVSEKYLEKF